jgi:hypothetical protein
MRARNAWLLGIAVLVATGCSATVPPAAALPTQRAGSHLLSATPTPLATERLRSATPKPKVTAKPAPKATPRPIAKPAPFYKPPGWDGYSDVNCSDFDTHAHAQSFFIGTGGSRTNDPYRLDGDHDGQACESLP